ncbi:MAG TPA: DNA/RNA non-specific endonuclease [Desulfovibrio sp.]|uniref:DNA/RNA non-specific endonuclease n=1 Tax=Desulfovibrio sp. TaxID=885 RepID=UPI002C8ED148|nr:DNA/RNA non-specific endonuclease [Desulfovibrio sp.]HMM38564.1 DNA/RNA non-specific endonuclease [Desulfovibrio sp.]
MITVAPLLLTGVGIGSKIVQGNDPSFADAITLVGLGASIQAGVSIGSKVVQGENPSLADATALVRSGVAAQGSGPSVWNPPPASREFAANAPSNDVTTSVTDDLFLQAQLDKFSPVHQKEQIANGDKYITLSAEVVSNETVSVQGGTRQTIGMKQQVVEQRYLDHGNIMDFVAALRAGQTPTLDAALLALVDCLDALTLNMLRPMLLHWKLDSHVMVKAVEVRIDDQVRDSVENAPQVIDEQTSKQVEERSGPDKVLETVSMRSVDKQTLSHVEGRQITTITYAPHAQMQDVLNTSTIESIDRESFVAVQENVTTGTLDKQTTTESKQILGWDLGSVIGEKVTPGPESQSLDSTTKLRIYHSKDAGDFTEALADGKLTDTEARGLKLELVDDKRIDSPTQFSVLSEGGAARLETGLIEWVPLGSLVTMAAKSSYGMDVTASDIFWGAFDVMLTVGTLGTATVIANSAKTVGKQVVKGLVKGAVKETADVVTKASGKVVQAVLSDIKDFTPSVFKHPKKLSLRGSEKVAQDGMKHVAQDELALGAKAGAHGTENAAKAMGESRTSLKPNSAITTNGYKFTTDAFGRVNSAKGQLRLEKVPHDPIKQRTAAQMGHAGDHGGHLIGAQFSGPSELHNLVPQNGSLNLGEWKKMEMGWKKALEVGKNVKVNIQPLYNGTSLRPHKFIVAYRVDGVKEIKVFTNHLQKV